MSTVMPYVGWFLYAVALITAPFFLYTIKFDRVEVENRVARVLHVAVFIPLVGFLFWGAGYVFMWFGEAMATPVTYIFSLF